MCSPHYTLTQALISSFAQVVSPPVRNVDSDIYHAHQYIGASWLCYKFFDCLLTFLLLMLLCRYVRKHIGSAMSLRMTPEIRFMKDEFIQRGEQVRQHGADTLLWQWTLHKLEICGPSIAIEHWYFFLQRTASQSCLENCNPPCAGRLEQAFHHCICLTCCVSASLVALM